jgi:hypothetical protein
MIETFTKNSSITGNGIEMERHNNSDNLGTNELAFYHSLTEGLDSLKREPKTETVQSVLNYSKKLRSVK